MRPTNDATTLPRSGEIRLTPETGSRRQQPASGFADSLYLHIAVAAGLLWLVLNGV